VNLFGVMRMTKAVLPAMRRQGKGISSVLGFIPSPYNAIYAASKHAVEGYSESLDHELRTFGIRWRWSSLPILTPRSRTTRGPISHSDL
jgi:short-subunit dehydrogenase